jgi:hypothetical protein
MRSTRLTEFFERPEVRYTHSRPHVSDHNAFIEGLFATLEDRASFPEYFHTLDQARTYVDALMTWYNGSTCTADWTTLRPTRWIRGKDRKSRPDETSSWGVPGAGDQPDSDPAGWTSASPNRPSSPSMRLFPTLEPPRDILPVTRRTLRRLHCPIAQALTGLTDINLLLATLSLYHLEISVMQKMPLIKISDSKITCYNWFVSHSVIRRPSTQFSCPCSLLSCDKHLVSIISRLDFFAQRSFL